MPICSLQNHCVLKVVLQIHPPCAVTRNPLVSFGLSLTGSKSVLSGCHERLPGLPRTCPPKLIRASGAASAWALRNRKAKSFRERWHVLFDSC